MKRPFLIVVLFAIFVSARVHADDNTYRNPTLGLAIEKPEEWHFLSATEVAENLDNVQLSDEEFDQFVKKYAGTPIVAMTKHKEPFDDLNPSVKIDIKPLNGFSADQPVRILETISRPLVAAFPGLQFVNRPKSTKLSKLEAAFMSVDYDLMTADGRSFPTRSELWVVPRGRMFFLIGIGTRQDETTGTRAEVHKIVESIEIVNESDPE